MVATVSQPRRPATAPGSMSTGFAPSLSPSSSTHGSRPVRSSPLAGPVLSRVSSRRSLDRSTRDDDAIDHARSPSPSTLSFVGTSSLDAGSSSFSLVPASKRGADGLKDKNSSAMSALNFFRRPSSTTGHSSTGHSTTSHSNSSATTHSSILTCSTSSTQLTQCSTSSIDPAFPPPALTHSRPGSGPVSFVDIGRPMSIPPRPTSVAGMSSHVKRPFPVVRSQSSIPTTSPSTYRRSTLNPDSHQRLRTSTNADNRNPLWASVTSTVPTDASKTQVPSKPGGPTSAASQSPFGPAEIPRFSRAALKESGIVMPISVKDWRRRQSVTLPSPPDLSNGLNARSVDKGKGKAREQRISFVDRSAREPRSSQVPTVQVVPADATRSHAQVEVHPPTPTPDVPPSKPIVTPSIVVAKPEMDASPETEQRTVTPIDESRVLSPKSSTNTFFSCTSDVSNKTPPSPASLLIPPPSPTTSSSLFPSSDSSSEEKSHSAARPRPRARCRSNPQSISAGNRLSFVDAMMRLSVGSFRSFDTAQSVEGEGDNTPKSEGDGAPRDVDGDEEGAVLARTRSLDDLASSPLLSPPPLSPVSVQPREHKVMEEAHAISHLSPASRRVTAEWVGGAPRGATTVPYYTMPTRAGGNGDSEASVVSLRANDGNVSRVEGVADESTTRNEVDKRAKTDVPDEQNSKEQSVPHILTPTSQPVRQQTQKKRKLTKSRPPSISSSVHHLDLTTTPTQATSVEPGPGNMAMLTPAAVPAGPSVHNAPKHAPTVLSTIAEDGSSHGHRGSSSGHSHEQERIDADDLRSGKVREDHAARDTTRETSHVVESIPAEAVPSQVGLMSPNGQMPSTKGDVKETTVIANANISAPSKAGSDTGTPSRSKRYSFLLPVLSFGKSKLKHEVRGQDGSPSSAGVTSGTHQAGIGPGDVVGAHKKGGKMRKKRDPDAFILPVAPKDANVTISQSAADMNDELNIPPDRLASADTNIAALPQSSEITLVASPLPYASPSSALPFTTVNPPSSFGSVPRSASSSLRIPATARSGNPVLPATEGVVLGPSVEAVLCVNEAGSKTADDLCLAHRLSHGHLSKDAMLTTLNITATDEEAIATVSTGHLHPTSALLAPKPGTPGSTLTTLSDDASFSTVPLPNPWDGDPVLNPVRLVTPEPQLQLHRPCPMCGCSSPELTSRLPVQQLFESRLTIDTAAAPSPAFASQFSASEVQTPTYLQKSNVPRSLATPPSHFQPSAFPSPCPPFTSTHSPRKLKRAQTSLDITHKRGSPKTVGSRKGEGSANASASTVNIPALPKVERESKARGVLRRLLGNA